MVAKPVRIAMWSGPRNISTAMMRAFENRPDTVVTDEPLYGHYLATSGADHPDRDAVIAAQATDWRRVTAALTGPVPGGKAVWYQKHMTHHLLPGVGRDWLDRLRHAFLIRDPREVLDSYARARAGATLADIGIVQQALLYDEVVARTGCRPPVLDARDVLDDPAGALRQLCAALDIAFSPRMLAWPAGPRPSDGVWAQHWYASVWRSTGFRPHRPPTRPLPADLVPIADAALPAYHRLRQHRLAASPSAAAASPR